MTKMTEREPGTRIEEEIAAEILGDEGVVSLIGLAVTVIRTNRTAKGIGVTAQACRTPVLETNLRQIRPKTHHKGVIFAIDPDHNALWLRPQRLSVPAMDTGFLVAAGFVQDEVPAYSVTVREPGWRDGEPGVLLYADEGYPKSGMPDLLDQDWKWLDTEVPATPSEA